MTKNTPTAAAGAPPHTGNKIRLPGLLERTGPAWVALAIALAVTFGLWRWVTDAESRAARQNFEQRAAEIEGAIQSRMVAYQQVLRGFQGILEIDPQMSRAVWHRYYQSLGIDDHYPGIQGVSYARWLTADALPSYVQQVRAEGYADFHLTPSGARAAYAPVHFIAPFAGTNLRAFGYDTYAEPVRRAALNAARDSGNATITGKIRLVQEAEQVAQAGFLMALPVYRSGVPAASPAQRRDALQGFVTGVFRMNDLIAGIIGTYHDVDIEIFDGAASADNLLYDGTNRARAAAPSAGRLTRSSVLILYDREWTLLAASRAAPPGSKGFGTGGIVLFAGTLVSALLFMLVAAVLRTREQALRLASRMTQDLRISAERLRLALDSAGMFLFDWHIVADELYLSENWAVMGGAARRSTTMTSIAARNIVHPQDARDLKARTTDALKGVTRVYRAEFRMRTGSGWYWVHVEGVVIERDVQGRALRLMGVGSNVTERKEAERAKSEFLSTVAHELRTPLTAIHSTLSMAAAGLLGSYDTDAKRQIEVAHHNAQRLSRLADDILDLERMDAGQLAFKIVLLPLLPLVEQAIAAMEPYAAGLNVRFALQATAQPTVQVDDARLVQALTNLMSNAAKFAPAGSQVKVTVGADQGKVRVTVIDSGPGIPQEFRARLFQRFEQAATNESRVSGGAGLGLSITRSLMEAMDGSVGYLPAEGGGAAFYVELPMR